MFRQNKRFGFLLLAVALISGCSGSRNANVENTTVNTEFEMTSFDKQFSERMTGGDTQATLSTIVYKTTGDFQDYVPVTMNPEKTEILSYPAPSDLFYKGKLAKPTRLNKGYLLDNRGINENTVFLNYTYEEYSRMQQTPSSEEMKKNIKEKYPILEIIDCGNRYQYKDEVKDLNVLINAGFPGMKRITKK